MPSVASEMFAFVWRPDHHGPRNAAVHADEHARPFSKLLDESHPEPEAESPPRTGPTRVDRTERPAESADVGPATDAPAETQRTDGAPQSDAASPEETAQANADGTTGIVEPDLPGAPADGSGEGTDELMVVAAANSPAVNQPVSAPAMAQPGAETVTGVVPAEGGEPAAKAAPQVEATAPLSAGSKAAPAASTALPADGAIDTEAAATAPLVKAAAGKSEKKAQATPPELETATLAPEQTTDVKKPDAPNLAQPPKTAARPQPAADPLPPSDLMTMSADEVEVRAHGEQTQSLAAAQIHAAQSATGSSAAAQSQQQAPLVPVAGLAIEIAAQARAGKNRFEIRLDPPELGRIDVRLDIDREGNVTSRLVVERAETLDLLRRDAHSLERALNQAGLKTADNSLQFSLRDQGGDQRQGGDESRGERVAVPDEDHAIVAPLRNYGRLLGLGTGLDIRV